MYVVEDETFRQARSILSALAKELTDREESGSSLPTDLVAVIRRSAQGDLPVGAEAAYVSSLSAALERLFPIEELFPRRRRARDH
ncbi:MAG: hypothetical protein OEW24_00385 [Chloroflexota bacterium]|nr:hypothetical protein [Chloroflexota bacterium]